MANIIFDIDGCLCDFMYGFSSLANQYFGTPIKKAEDQYQWFGHEQLGLTRKQYDFIWEKVKTSEVFWTQLQPLLDASIFARLDSLTIDASVYFVSARPGVYVKQQTERWLQQQGICRPTVIISDRKGEIASGIKADFALDDKAGNAVFMKYASPKTEVYLLDRPYNGFDHTIIGAGVKRISLVEDYLKVVEDAI